MNSQEIAEQIAMQNQMFLGQSAMASQIGVAPGAYGQPGVGLGGYGFFNRQQPVMPQAPGGRRTAGAFDYGGSMFTGYGAGNRGAAIGTASMAAMPFLGSAGATMLSSGTALAPLFNPLAAFGAARGAGMGMMGAGVAAMGVAAPMAAISMGMQHVVGSAIQGAHQQSTINTAMGGYNFANPMSRTGQGFSRQDTQQVGDNIRQLAYIPELMTSVDELTKLLPKLKGSGLMFGARDAGEFNKRFKEAVTTVREVSKVLGTTMEDAAEFFAHSRRVGFLGKTDQLKNALNAQVTMSTTGMGMDRFQQLQQSGADFGTALGFSRGSGARAATNTANALGIARLSGTLPEGLLEDATGKTDIGDATADAAMRITNVAARIAGTHLGRFAVAGAMDLDEDGKPSINKDALRRGSSVSQVRENGLRRLSSGRSKIAFEANQERLTGEYIEKGGMSAVKNILQSAVGNQHGPDAIKLLLKQQNVSESDIDLVMAAIKGEEQGLGGLQEAIAQIKKSQSDTVQKKSPGAVWQRFKTRIGAQVSAPFKQWGAEVSLKVSQSVDDVLDDIVGNYLLKTSEQARKDISAAFTSSSKKDWNNVMGTNELDPYTNEGFRGDAKGNWTREDLVAGKRSHKNAPETPWYRGFWQEDEAAQTQQVMAYLGGGENGPGTVNGKYRVNDKRVDNNRKAFNSGEMGNWGEGILGSNSSKLLDQAQDAAGEVMRTIGGEASQISDPAKRRALLQTRLKEDYLANLTRENARTDPEIIALAKRKGTTVEALIDSGAAGRKDVNSDLFQIANVGPGPSYESVVIASKEANRKFDSLLGAESEGVKGAKTLTALREITSATGDPAKRAKAYQLADMVQGATTDASWKTDTMAQLAKDLGLSVAPKDMNPDERNAFAAALRKLRRNADGSSKDFNPDDVKVIEDQFMTSKQLANASVRKVATNIATKFDSMKEELGTRDSKLTELTQAASSAWADFGSSGSAEHKEAAVAAVKALDTYIASKVDKGSEDDRKFYGGAFAAAGSITGGSGERRNAVQGLVKQFGTKDAISAANVAKQIGVSEESLKKEFGQTSFVMDEKMQSRLTDFATKGALGGAVSQGTAVEDQKKRDTEQINALRAITEAILASKPDMDATRAAAIRELSGGPDTGKMMSGGK
jgi:hypothetical protein